ncbi:MAG: hypothetical protein DLM53_03750 [Candidatus Eremiobacter antarcticus]|nr:CYTH and CHAD domain-containing protein [Candidatus Eremiobacteraeota bacterium]MBC5807387.1 CYTH and CHAD domain-containing protein [Candidatus Eremiobacteraeota bacterium]PZR63138.1 MAG: hypothetical protein DLM53_03750 [Candidatus Eremiobacter sp. RRmetagenome_bin22]
MEMRIENEIKLRVPANFDISRAIAHAGPFTAMPLEKRTLQTVYYDTADLRLTRWGSGLRYRAGDGWMLKLGLPKGDAGLRRLEVTAAAGSSGAPPAELLEVATAFLRGEAVRPVSRLRTLRKSMRLCDKDGRDVAEVVDDNVRATSDDRPAIRWREIEIELCEGAAASRLRELQVAFEYLGGDATDQTPKHVRALGLRTPLRCELDAPSVGRSSSCADVIRAALTSSVERLLRQDAFLRLDMDADAVHAARVATRRLRSDLRTFLPLLERSFACDLRDQLKWLASELGAVRDADVLVQRLRAGEPSLPASYRPSVRRTVSRFVAECAAARERLREVLKDQRYCDLLARLITAASEPRLAAAAHSPASDVLPTLMRDPWGKLCEAVQAVDDGDHSAARLHQVRIRAKRCRYAAEAAVPVVGKAARRFAKRVERLQRVLGEFHDANVAEQRLRKLSGDGDTMFAAGLLAALQALDAAAAREAWRKAWRKADKKRLRTWIL